MTIFGPDISSYEHGVDVSKLAEQFVLLKCTEGTYYADADYANWLAQAKASKKLVVAYHFLTAQDAANGQASWMAQHIIDKTVPVMLDIETEGASKPSFPLVLKVADAMRQQGLNVRLAYLPKWYWEGLNGPELTPLAQRGIGLVSSNYPRSGPVAPISGYAADGGDSGPGWAPYGGLTPILWQYTDAGVEQQRLDFNAFRGTINELAAFLHGTSAAPNLGGDVTPDEHNWLTNLYSGMFYGGSSCGPVVPAGHPGAGSNALFAHIEYITGMLEKISSAPVPTPVDTEKLAASIVAAIEQHLGSGADAQAVAVAVQAQLAQALGGHGAG